MNNKFEKFSITISIICIVVAIIVGWIAIYGLFYVPSSVPVLEDATEMNQIVDTTGTSYTAAISTGDVFTNKGVIVVRIGDSELVVGSAINDTTMMYKVKNTEDLGINQTVHSGQKIVLKNDDDNITLIARNDLNHGSKIESCVIHEVVIDCKDVEESIMMNNQNVGALNVKEFNKVFGKAESVSKNNENVVFTWNMGENVFIEAVFANNAKQPTQVRVLAY